MKASELTGDDLALWAGRATGREYTIDKEKVFAAFSAGTSILTRDADGKLILQDPDLPELTVVWRPHEDWAQGGPIIERERITIAAVGKRSLEWFAEVGGAALDTGVEVGCSTHCAEDPAPLVAAMRAFVHSKFGDEVPDEAQESR